MNEDHEPALATEDDRFFFTAAELQLIENTLEQKIEALSACFGVLPLGEKTRAVAEHRNELLPLHAKVKEMRQSLA